MMGVLIVVGIVGLWLGLGAPDAAATGCPPDSVRSGTICIDKYEASVWDLSGVSGFAKFRLLTKIRIGIVTEADLLAAGAIQLGLNEDDLATAGCPVTGNGCVNFYAVSIPGVFPSRFMSWFQAAAAARNSWKRLASNAEWQAAALGTPDPGNSPGAEDCNTAGSLDLTGARSSCVSDTGAFDMVGNVQEWVADWVPRSTDCPGWSENNAFNNDRMCLAGAATLTGPGALLRGGNNAFGTESGVFFVDGRVEPSSDNFGFRAAR
jgi:hypothetical protein